MKILHVISSVDPAGGGPIEGVKQLGEALVEGGHRVEVASLDSPLASCVKLCPLPTYPLGPPTLAYRYSSRLVPWLRAHHRDYDAVVVNGIWQFHSLAAWRVLHGTSTPYVLFTHGMLDPWFKQHYPLKHLKKWMYWPWAEYRVLRDARAVLFTCDEERRLARRSFWLYRCNEVVVNYGTAQPLGDAQREREKFLEHHPELRGKRLILFVGRIHPKKGCDLLIEAFAAVLGKYPDWHLVMAGPDQVGWQQRLEWRATELGIARRITWTGMISGTLKWGALRAAEVLVLPSHQENFGIVVAEALAVGVPALISNKVNIWREIAADDAGMVAPDSLAGTCQLLRSYLELPTAARLAMRDAARRCFARRFEIKQAARGLQSVLAGLGAMN